MMGLVLGALLGFIAAFLVVMWIEEVGNHE